MKAALAGHKAYSLDFVLSQFQLTVDLVTFLVRIRVLVPSNAPPISGHLYHTYVYILYTPHSLLLCIHPHFLQWLLYETDFLYVVQLVLSLQDQEYGEGTGWFF